jgi:large subunit ribosomal protein L15
MPLKIRLPKFGFRSRIGLVTAEVRSSELAQVEGDVVDLSSLQAANIITKNIKYVKVMLSGEVSRALTIKGIRVSKGAADAVTKAGGKLEA